ncbi:zinc finger protein 469 [Protopterus annectens]|uniref:zinc finger protein 469 n=1 Tax=Protopterus annectens TaxID=7888 RepID=UPI001CFA3CC6|nr:zinc finger protein 469 [Protopterus annectens]
MTGETQHVYGISDSEKKSKQDREAVCEHFTEKDVQDFCGNFLDSSDHTSEIGSHYCIKEKESHTQREAVIRPQQAGKIDFKSLQGRSQFTCDGTWSSNKGNPQSPTSKNRLRDKTKRVGKGDSNPHQLYRLSIANSRANPTIGIAYPQQKVTPQKKLEANANRGPVTGSYHFHISNLPEGETALQLDDLSFNQCFSDSSVNLTSSSYTSQVAASTQPHHTVKTQQPTSISRDTANADSQLQYSDFQINGADSWHAADKDVGSSSYDVSAEKPYTFPGNSKSNTQDFELMPYHYPFQHLQDAVAVPFGSDQSAQSQDYLDSSLAHSQAAHGAFVFHSGGKDDSASNGHYNSLQQDGRAYVMPSQQAPFLHVQPQSVLHQASVPCYKGRNEHPGDINGAISSGANDSSGATQQTLNVFSENQSTFPSSEFSLHNNNTASIHKRVSAAKDNGASHQMVPQGNSVRRNAAQNSLSQQHFQTKSYSTSVNGVKTATVPFDKNISNTVQPHSQVPQTWEGTNTIFSAAGQNCAPYSTSVGNHFSFHCQSSNEQRQQMSKNRSPWQQIQLTAAMPNQNRIDLSRQLSNQTPFTAVDWQGGKPAQSNAPLNSSSGFHNKMHMTGDGYTSMKVNAVPQNCNAANFTFENGGDVDSTVSDSRYKNGFFGMSHPVPTVSSRSFTNHLATVAPVTVMSSPYASPQASPVPNPACSSTCSTLSPVSSSPSNTSLDDIQLQKSITTSTFSHQSCSLKEDKIFPAADQMATNLLQYHQTDPLRSLSFPNAGNKDNLNLNNLQEHQFHRPNMENIKGCQNDFECEPPPPYSSHHMLTSSLSNASLEHLDILLTCKQCDQNFNNLVSFLDHRQYCGSHSVCQTELKDVSRDCRRYQSEVFNTSLPSSSLSVSRPFDLSLVLQGSNKNSEFLLDCDNKGETKDDSLKPSMANSLAANSLPVTASEMEIDAKLDSLITEALNGLGYQSDNAEIDSSFIDGFVDDEICTAKAAVSVLAGRVKDSFPVEESLKQIRPDKTALHTNDKFFCEENSHVGKKYKNKNSEKRNSAESIKPCLMAVKDQIPDKPLENKRTRTNLGDQLMKERSSEKNSKLKGGSKIIHPKEQGIVNKLKPYFTPKNNLEYKGRQDDYQSHTSQAMCKDATSVKSDSKVCKFPANDTKRKKSTGGSWSKELIHKIVQQKNKHHKLHVKGNKHFQFSLVTEKLMPTTHIGKYGEYDYVSDSDDEGLNHQKITTRGHSEFILKGKMKYNSEHENQVESNKNKETNWRFAEQQQIQSQNVCKDAGSKSKRRKYYSGRARRSRQSSSSSDLSTSTDVSSESTPSPKSTDRTESDNENNSITSKRKSSSIKDKLPYLPDRNSNTDENCVKGYEFSRTSKRLGSAKFLLTDAKLRQSRPYVASTIFSSKACQPRSTGSGCEEKTDSSINFDGNYSKRNIEAKPAISTNHNDNISNSLPECDNTANVVQISKEMQNQFSPVNQNTTDYPMVLAVKNMFQATENTGTNINCRQSSINVLKSRVTYSDSKEFESQGTCLKDNSDGLILNKEMCNDSTFGSSNGNTYETKESFQKYSPSDIQKPVITTISQAEYVPTCHTGLNTNSFEKSHSEQGITFFPAENEKNKVCSPFAFDSPSMFGEFPVTAFDSPVYNTNQASRSERCQHLYSPFLLEREWALMEDVTTVLEGNTTQLTNPFAEKQLSKKCIEEGPSALSKVSTPASEFSTVFPASISVDESEIKKLVTELENKLQKSKQSHSTPETRHSLETQINSGTEADTNNFSLTVEQNMGNHNELFFTSDFDSFRDTNLLEAKEGVASIPISNAADQTQDQANELPDNLWTSHLRSFNEQAQGHLPLGDDTDSLNTFCSAQEDGLFHLLRTASSSVKAGTKDTKSNCNSPLSLRSSLEVCDDKIEKERYTEKLMKSLAVISHSVFNTNTEEQARVKEKTLQAFQIEHGCYDSCSLDIKSTEQSQLIDHSIVSVTVNETGLSNLSNSINLLEQQPSERDDDHISERSDTNTEHNQSEICLPTSGGNSNASFCKMQQVLTDTESELQPMANVSAKEGSHMENTASSQESSVNPLQQLQLFVARTVKHNEEEMRVPCFSGLVPAPSQTTPNLSPEQKQNEFMSASNLECEASVTCTSSSLHTVFSTSGGTLRALDNTSEEVNGQHRSVTDKLKESCKDNVLLEKQAQSLYSPPQNKLIDETCITDISPEPPSPLSLNRVVSPLVEHFTGKTLVISEPKNGGSSVAVTCKEYKKSDNSDAISVPEGTSGTLVKLQMSASSPEATSDCNKSDYDLPLTLAGESSGKEDFQTAESALQTRTSSVNCDLNAKYQRTEDEHFQPSDKYLVSTEMLSENKIITTDAHIRERVYAYSNSSLSLEKCTIGLPHSTNDESERLKTPTHLIKDSEKRHCSQNLTACSVPFISEAGTVSPKGTFKIPQNNSEVEYDVSTCINAPCSLITEAFGEFSSKILSDVQQSDQKNGTQNLCDNDQPPNINPLEINLLPQLDLSVALGTECQSYKEACSGESEEKDADSALRNTPTLEHEDISADRLKCPSSEVLCSRYKAGDDDSTASQINDLLSLPEALLNEQHPPQEVASPVISPKEHNSNTDDYDIFSSYRGKCFVKELPCCEDNRTGWLCIPSCSPLSDQETISYETKISDLHSPAPGIRHSSELTEVSDNTLFSNQDVVRDFNLFTSMEMKIPGSECGASMHSNTDRAQGDVSSSLKSRASREPFNHAQEDSSAKQQQNKAQSAVICDVCSASFRSKPGLMRHKAFKHRAKCNDSSVMHQASKNKLDIVLSEKSMPWNNDLRKNVDSSFNNEGSNLKENDLHSVGHHENETSSEDVQQLLIHMTTTASNPKVISETSCESCELNLEHNSADVLKETVKSKARKGSETERLHQFAEKDTCIEENQGPDCKPKSLSKKRPSLPKSEISETISVNKQRKKHVRGAQNGSQSRFADTHKNSRDTIPDSMLKSIKSDLLKAIMCPIQSSSSPFVKEKDGFHSNVQSNLEEALNPVQEKCNAEEERSLNTAVHAQQYCESNTESIQGHRCDGAIIEDGWQAMPFREDADKYVEKREYNANEEMSSNIKEKNYPPVNNLFNECKVNNNKNPFGAPDMYETLASGISNNENSSNKQQNKTAERLDNEDAYLEAVICSGDIQLKQNQMPTSSATPSEIDLHNLYDDESTFSQLFPGGENVIRRRCVRVYGNKNKQMKCNSETVCENETSAQLTVHGDTQDPDHQNDISGCGERPIVCEYETISVDDALLLNMHHNNKNAKNINFDLYDEALKTELEDNYQAGDFVGKATKAELQFLYQNKVTEVLCKPHVKSTKLDFSDETVKNANNEMPNKLSSDVKKEGIPLSLAAAETCDETARGSLCSEFHTIDMEALNTKLEIGDASYFTTNDQGGNFAVDSFHSTSKAEDTNTYSRTKLEGNKTAKKNRTVTRTKQYKCKVCFQWFLTLGELDFHKLSHNPSPPPTCYMCVQRKFSSREQLRDHLNEKHAKKKAGLWTCGMCLKEISDVWMYNEHLREHATQFARKGQAQKSVMDCFTDDNVVTNFLNTILFRRLAKSSKHSEADNRCSLNKDSKVFGDCHEQEATDKVTTDSDTKYKLNTTSSIKVSTSPSSDDAPKADLVHKNNLMHPACKDPSRDCHHCGKQFPKPFKLQRHLVVHSLQKMYLCHKCPVFFQDMADLRNHLNKEHGIMEEPEIKHTTLYACELCADVMHIIKKSFICSTCNYTFSKKEQYDRHMEKHLEGGNTTIKFRGVMRPYMSTKEINCQQPETLLSDCLLPTKKPRTAQDDITSFTCTKDPTSIKHLQLCNEMDLHLCEKNMPVPPVLFPDVDSIPASSLQNSTVKTEDVVGDFTEILSQLEDGQSQADAVPQLPCLSPPLSQSIFNETEGAEISSFSMESSSQNYEALSPTDFMDNAELRITGNFTGSSQDKQSASRFVDFPEDVYAGFSLPVTNHTESNPLFCENPTSPQNIMNIIPLCDKEKERTEFSDVTEKISGDEAQQPQWNSQNVASANVQSLTKEDIIIQDSLPSKNVPLVSNSSRKDGSICNQNEHICNVVKEQTTDNNLMLNKVNSIQIPPLSTEKLLTPDFGCNSRESIGVSVTKGITNVPKLTLGQNKNETSNNAKEYPDSCTPSEKQCVEVSLKCYPKKRKEHKPLNNTISTDVREHVETNKKKKVRVHSPGRCENTVNAKKTDLIHNLANLSSIKDNATNYKLHNKPKTGAINNQLKRIVFDSYGQKKVDIHHGNGEFKCKKESFGRTFHHIMFKGPSSPMNNSINKNRSASSLKPADSQNYRTAESQNNLLSQLFGQKLTSFKIPLRKDLSE